MQTIQLTNDQSQQFTSTIENDRYSIAIYFAGGTMCCDISRNEEVLLTGQRITSGQFMIPFYYESAGHGNFMLVTQNEALPDFAQFGITQTLIYYTIAEMQAVFAGTL